MSQTVNFPNIEFNQDTGQAKMKTDGKMKVSGEDNRGAVATAMAQGYMQFQLDQLENQQNLYFWNLNNEYNTPAAQVQRMLDAGLNPAIYGQSLDPGNASAMQAADLNAPDIQYQPRVPNILNGMNVALDGLSKSLQYKQLSLESDRVDLERKRVENDTRRVDNESSLADANIKKIMSETGLNRVRVNEILQNIKESDSRIDLTREMVSKAKLEQSQIAELTRKTHAEFERIELLTPLERSHMAKQLDIDDRQMAVLEKTAKKLVSESLLTDYQVDTEKARQSDLSQSASLKYAETILKHQLYKFNGDYQSKIAIAQLAELYSRAAVNGSKTVQNVAESILNPKGKSKDDDKPAPAAASSQSQNPQGVNQFY